MLRCGGQSGNEDLRRNPEFQGNPFVHLLREVNSVAALARAHREISIHGNPNSLL